MIATGLRELRRHELQSVVGGSCSPSYIDICMDWLGTLVVAIASTAPASSYAYGKVGYTS